MIKKRFGLIFILIILFGISSTLDGSGKFSLTLDGGYAGAFSLTDTTYSETKTAKDSWGDDMVTVTNTGTIAYAAAAGITFGGSLDYMFTDMIGISISFHYTKSFNLPLCIKFIRKIS